MEDYYNVLNALRNSKKYWDKPPLEYGPNNPEVRISVPNVYYTQVHATQNLIILTLSFCHYPVTYSV